MAAPRRKPRWRGRSRRCSCSGSDGAALLQHRDDKPELRRAGMWVPPGGGLDPGEPAEAGARREIREETGYLCGELHAARDGAGRPGGRWPGRVSSRILDKLRRQAAVTLFRGPGPAVRTTGDRPGLPDAGFPVRPVGSGPCGRGRWTPTLTPPVATTKEASLTRESIRPAHPPHGRGPSTPRPNAGGASSCESASWRCRKRLRAAHRRGLLLPGARRHRLLRADAARPGGGEARHVHSFQGTRLAGAVHRAGGAWRSLPRGDGQVLQARRPPGNASGRRAAGNRGVDRLARPWPRHRHGMPWPTRCAATTGSSMS